MKQRSSEEGSTKKNLLENLFSQTPEQVEKKNLAATYFPTNSSIIGAGGLNF